jgi:hypothetical protein
MPAARAMASIAACPLLLTPAVATATAPGLAFIASSSSFIVLYGVSAFTPTTAMCATLRYMFQSLADVSSMPSTL